ncbi:30S ribosome-binding factor RbfA [Aestuariibacter halophilus]|uniref:Ribosome-binding factor A n=1 Tax=Fluctibacter halophilus TaxID=226011 RepID=A0ABS8G411_9ALTE|nr:30S ribosome-binding factor RbfA [Aestuariibacter halophilus]MCC2615229.1 30S ribosome-binding factor RbfA [Aestuariibacter halophilus]
MAREFSRTERVGQQIHKEVASILQQEIKHRDPRLGMVTVSGVDVSRDLAHAKVYVTFYVNDPAVTKLSMEILSDNTGYVRSLLARRIRMRAVPSIKFVEDTSITEGMRISNLVTDTLNKDRERAAKAGRNIEDDSNEE